jgi:hypothetical protein
MAIMASMVERMAQLERRHFLADCPRNVGKNYTPPPVNTVNLEQFAKRYNFESRDDALRRKCI